MSRDKQPKNPELTLQLIENKKKGSIYIFN